MNRRAVLSIAFGVGAALLVATIGPVYATPLLIVAVPVVFLTMSRLAVGSTIDPDLGWLLFALAIGWLVLLPVAPIVRNSPEPWPSWAALGAIPLIVALGLAVRRRLFPTRDIRAR